MIMTKAESIAAHLQSVTEGLRTRSHLGLAGEHDNLLAAHAWCAVEGLRQLADFPATERPVRLAAIRASMVLVASTAPRVAALIPAMDELMVDKGAMTAAQAMLRLRDWASALTLEELALLQWIAAEQIAQGAQQVGLNKARSAEEHAAAPPRLISKSVLVEVGPAIYGIDWGWVPAAQ